MGQYNVFVCFVVAASAGKRLGSPGKRQEALGMLSGAPGCSVELWGAPEMFGRLWEALRGLGKLWEALGSSRGLWEAMGISRISIKVKA